MLSLHCSDSNSGGYIVSAIFTCWEYQRLGVKYRQHRILAASFWIKLAFILVEFVLAIGKWIQPNPV